MDFDAFYLNLVALYNDQFVQLEQNLFLYCGFAKQSRGSVKPATGRKLKIQSSIGRRIRQDVQKISEQSANPSGEQSLQSGNFGICGICSKEHFPIFVFDQDQI